jgi:hypothetical protein
VHGPGCRVLELGLQALQGIEVLVPLPACSLQLLRKHGRLIPFKILLGGRFHIDVFWRARALPVFE